MLILPQDDVPKLKSPSYEENVRYFTMVQLRSEKP